MNKPDLDIIRSPAAERMRRMVTEGFYDRSRTALWMFEVIGREYDEMSDWARNLKLEANPQTCTWSIGIWEWVYEFESDESLPLEIRRQRIMAKIIAQAPINPEVIRRGVAALAGANIEVIENAAPYTFKIIINSTDNAISLDLFEIVRYVRGIKPSHLTFGLRVLAKQNATLRIGAYAKSGVNTRISPFTAREINTQATQYTSVFTRTAQYITIYPLDKTKGVL